ncbi:hypothetical protein CSC2_21440 [Clostridium zeae]|uniref:Uncharacterized protein n=1 Tax=Clostridium zeae TaxID=2759022 RepID=A0ABQ1EA47_9CLOT|nr:hypothetical protein CSC2_21440 [Clostridium zeae]
MIGLKLQVLVLSLPEAWNFFWAMFKKIFEINWLNRRRYMSELLELNDFFRWNGVKELHCSNVVSLQF